jgi:hypothetical protein
MRRAIQKGAKKHHFDGSTNEVIFKIANRSKADLIRNSYEEVYGIQSDNIYRLSCLKADDKFNINHVTRLDECKWYIIALIEPEEITLLKLTKEKLWELKTINQNGKGDIAFIVKKSQIMDLNPEILTHL